MLKYIDMLNKSDEGIISFQMPHPEKYYTTKEIFQYFNVDINSTIANSGQIMATLLIMKNIPKLRTKLDWIYKVYEDNHLLVTDFYNKKQAPYFKDNRHDQSIFSVIRKLHNPILLDDETWFWGKRSLSHPEKYPFWATRKKY